MKNILGFVFGVAIVVSTGFVSAGPMDGCIGECRQDLVDCRELNQSNCFAQFASCKRNCG
jgi:hypothetical protein